MKQERSIPVAIILSIITCGLYEIYWFIVLTDEVNTVTGNSHDTSGGMSFVLNLVTCGIYGIYWSYKMGEKLDRYYGDNGSRSIVYLLLCLFGFGFVNCILIQDGLNKI